MGCNHQTIKCLRGGLPPLEVNLSNLVNSVFYFDDELMFFFINAQNLCLDILVIIHIEWFFVI